MNLKNRIRKAESKVKGTGEFCECKETPKFQTVYHEDGLPATSPELTRDVSAPLPDFCEQCRKPVDKTIVILNFVSSQIPKPEEVKP